MWKCRFLHSKMLGVFWLWFFSPPFEFYYILVFLYIFFRVILGEGKKEKIVYYDWDDFVILQNNSTLKWKSDWLRVKKDL